VSTGNVPDELKIPGPKGRAGSSPALGRYLTYGTEARRRMAVVEEGRGPDLNAPQGQQGKSGALHKEFKTYS
jgi:hypothetical protein